MENQINKDALVFINKEISKINRKLTNQHYLAWFFRKEFPLNPLIKEFEILDKNKNHLIIAKCFAKINQLNYKLILHFKRCDLDKMHKIQVEIIEQERIIKNIIQINYGKHNSNF